VLNKQIKKLLKFIWYRRYQKSADLTLPGERSLINQSNNNKIIRIQILFEYLSLFE